LVALELEKKNEKIEQVLNDIRRVRFMVLERLPQFFSSVTDKRIYITEDIPTASISSSGDLLVNPKFWESLSTDDKLVVLLHESLHGDLYHHERLHSRDEFDRLLWNIATDAFINSILSKIFPGSKLLSEAVSPMVVYEMLKQINPEEASRYSPEDFEKMNEEEIYRALRKALTKQQKKQGDRGSAEGSAKIGKYGNKTIERNVFKNPSEVRVAAVEEPLAEKTEKSGKEREIDKAARRARVRHAVRQTLKRAGTEPGDVETILHKLEPRGTVDWRNYLVATANSILSNKVISTYIKPSRRYETLPGYRRYQTPFVKAVFAVDVSGSISEETLRKFLEEVLWAKDVLGDKIKGYLITWDVGVRDVKKLDELRPGEPIHVTGGGGTVIDGALRKILEMSEAEGVDLAVVLTDGFILLEDKTLPSKLLTKVKHGIVLYTDAEPEDFGGWELARYNPNT